MATAQNIVERSGCDEISEENTVLSPTYRRKSIFLLFFFFFNKDISKRINLTIVIFFPQWSHLLCDTCNTQKIMRRLSQWSSCFCVKTLNKYQFISEVKHDVYGKRQTAKLKLFLSLISCV